MPTPNSPASPIPAMKRRMAYCSTETTKAFNVLAREYNNIEPNRVDILPFLSPKTPQNTPPINVPAICMFNKNKPCDVICSGNKPSDAKLGTRTTLKRMRS